MEPPSELGDLRRVGTMPNGYQLEFESGYVPASISLDSAGKVTGLLFKSPIRRAKSSSAVVDLLKPLPGARSALVLKNGTALLAHEAHRRLPVGSTFKLSALAALQERIRRGQSDWADVIELDDAAKSLPSGILHTWPTGTALTLHSVAAAMITISDNTATDLLIRFLGRESVERHSPARNVMKKRLTRYR